MKKPVAIVAVMATAAVALVAASPARAKDDGKHYKVFIYAGQSNAQGKAPNAIAEAQAKNPATADLYKPLWKDGKFIVRDDVFYYWAAQGPHGSSGPLKIGLGSFRGGGDYMFGSMMGDHFDEPVLLVKSAYGGSSLCQNFRPPSAGLPPDAKLQQQLQAAQARVKALNERNKKNDPLPTLDDIKQTYGHLYRQILAEYKDATQKFAQTVPALQGRTPELVGFVWFQGWNDQYGGQDEYAANLKCFIQDLRKDLGAPQLPFVIVAMGQNGSKPASGALLTIRDAQMAAQDVPEFKGHVKSIRADLLVDKDAERLWTSKDPEVRKREAQEHKFGADDGYHYYGSPIWYTRIGRAEGEAMLELLRNAKK